MRISQCDEFNWGLEDSSSYAQIPHPLSKYCKGQNCGTAAKVLIGIKYISRDNAYVIFE